jgi:hypothetical protein
MDGRSHIVVESLHCRILFLFIYLLGVDFTKQIEDELRSLYESTSVYDSVGNAPLLFSAIF